MEMPEEVKNGYVVSLSLFLRIPVLASIILKQVKRILSLGQVWGKDWKCNSLFSIH